MKPTRDCRESAALAVAVVAAAFLLYSAVAWIAFRWRNPTANPPAYFRHFQSVLAWRKLPEYQTTP